MYMKLTSIALISISSILVACSSGSTTNNNNSVIYVPTINYSPGNKTAVTTSIAGGNPIIAEIDTGSEITVVNESAIGTNLTKTSESLTIIYGAGTNKVSGYLAYGSVGFTTTNGQFIKTSPNTPLLVVTSGSVNQGGGNNAILGMRMNNQVSARLFMPYPYNQMMVLNRTKNFIAFGNLSTAQLNKFAVVAQQQINCANLAPINTANNYCWNSPVSATTYTYSLKDNKTSESNYPTIFDSGEALGNIYITPMPNWIESNEKGEVTNNVTAVINTNKGAIPLPITLPLHYTPALTPPGAINPGNLLFESYQVLFNQRDGTMGFVLQNESW